MQPDEFRRHAHELVDWMADYLDGVSKLPVTPGVEPGDIARRLPSSPPEHAARTSMPAKTGAINRNFLIRFLHHFLWS